MSTVKNYKRVVKISNKTIKREVKLYLKNIEDTGKRDEQHKEKILKLLKENYKYKEELYKEKFDYDMFNYLDNINNKVDKAFNIYEKTVIRI